jgi:hypothetical protein
MIRLKSLLFENIEDYKFDNWNWNYAKIESSKSAADLAELIKYSKGLFNDTEAVAEAAFMAISKFNIYDSVSKLLGQDPYEFVKSFIDTTKTYHKQSIDTSYEKIQTKIEKPKPKTKKKEKLTPEQEKTLKRDINWVLRSTGYNPNSGAYILAKIIATKEGWLPDANNGRGSRAYRNNNPGNLDYQDSFKKIDPGVKRESGSNGRFAVFSSPILGAKALIKFKIEKWANGGMPVTSTNQNMNPKYTKGIKPTIKQFITTYAPPSDSNNTSRYIADVVSAAKSKKSNVTADTLVSDLL